MNKNLIFSGKIGSIFNRKVKAKNGCDLVKQEIVISVQTLEVGKIIETTYYLTSWVDSGLKVGDSCHVICDLKYRKVTSNKATTLNAQGITVPFQYANWDFNVKTICRTNEELMSALNGLYGNWSPVKEKTKEEIEQEVKEAESNIFA